MNFETLLPVMPPYNIILEVDWEGKIINSWHSNSRELKFFCEAKVIVSCSIFFLCFFLYCLCYQNNSYFFLFFLLNTN